jgi:hypothetical protein
MSTQRSSSKRHFQLAFAQKSNKYATQNNLNKVKHHGGAKEVQPMAYHVKAVARGGGQGPTTPRRRPLPPWHLLASPSTRRWHVSMLWRCSPAPTKNSIKAPPTLVYKWRGTPFPLEHTLEGSKKRGRVLLLLSSN